jgi:hypothetical protein
MAPMTDLHLVETARGIAFFSVGRACLFGLLAIATVIMGLIGWPTVAVRAGAILTTLGAAVLIYRALRAPGRPYRRTEVWVLLRRESTVPEDRAQILISSVLGETYWRFAVYAAAMALFLWTLTILFTLTGLGTSVT